jgi:hypothetical protein
VLAGYLVFLAVLVIRPEGLTARWSRSSRRPRAAAQVPSSEQVLS